MFEGDAERQLRVAELLSLGLSVTKTAERLGRPLDDVEADASVIRQEWSSPLAMVRADMLDTLHKIEETALHARDSAESQSERRSADGILRHIAEQRARLGGETLPG